MKDQTIWALFFEDEKGNLIRAIGTERRTKIEAKILHSDRAANGESFLGERAIKCREISKHD